jgi:hypothetical protein
MYTKLIVRKTVLHTVEPLVPEPSPYETEIATEKLKVYNNQVMTKFRFNRLKVELML